MTRLRGERWALLALLAFVVATRVSFVVAGDEGAVAAPIVDDGFYNLTIARNVAEGRGFTFDGVETTTGFHPLVVATTAPIFALVPDRTTALRIVVAVWIALTVLLAWLLFRAVRCIGGPGPALCALLMFATGGAHGIVVNTLNGCDTVFGGILLLALVWFYLARVRPEPTLPVGRVIALGVLAGSLGWARLDLGLFAAALGVDLAITRRGDVRSLLAYGLTGLLTIAPWFAFNIVQTGRPMPENGRAVTAISVASAWEEMRLAADGFHGLVVANAGGGLPRYDPPDVSPTAPPPGFRRAMTMHAGLSLIKEMPVTGVVATWIGGVADRVGPKTSHAVRSDGLPLYGSLALAGLLAIGLAIRGRRREDAALHWLVVAGLAVFLAYPLVVFGQWFYGRYYFPLVLVSLLATPRIARVFGIRRSRVVTIGLVALFGGAFAIDPTNRSLFAPAPRPFYAQAERVATHVPTDAVVGGLQAGHLGFFCPQRVVNLDGKVSERAHRALVDGRVLTHARAAGVQIITDWPSLIDWMVVRRSTGGEARRIHRIDPPPGDPRPTNAHGWVAYRLAD